MKEKKSVQIGSKKLKFVRSINPVLGKSVYFSSFSSFEGEKKVNKKSEKAKSSSFVSDWQM